MNEDYVSYEAAKLLKEKGFDWPCQAFYGNNGALIASPVHTINDELENSDIACPTLYMAQKWLRNEKHIIVSIDNAVSGRNAIRYRWVASKGIISDYGTYDAKSNWIIYKTYEEALQTGILEALKLI